MADRGNQVERRAGSDLAILNEFAVSLLQQESLDDLLWSMAERIGVLLGFDDCVIYLVEDGSLKQRAAFGVKNPVGREIFKPITIPLGQGIVGRVAVSGVSEMVRDIRQDPTYIPDQFPGLSELAVPILFEGRVIGVLDSEADAVDAYSEDDRDALQWLANIAAPRVVYAQGEHARQLAQQRLQEANLNLERSVEARTRELLDAVVSLEAEIEQRRMVERALEAETQRAQATLESMSEGVIATDAHGDVVLFNAAAEQLTGWSLSEALGRPLRSVVVTAAGGGGPHDDDPSEASLADAPQDDTEPAPGPARRLKRRDGTERRVHETREQLRTASGDILGMVVVLRDVTEQLALQEAVDRNRRLESLGVLAGGIAHDFNNLLASVRASVELLAEAKADGVKEKAVQVALSALSQAATLPQRLIALSKGGAPLKGRPASLEPLIRTTVEAIAAPPGIERFVEIPANLHQAEFDESQVGRVVANLVINAQQALAGQGRVSVSARNVAPPEDGGEGGMWVEIAVEDNGPGISETDLAHIFDPYFTTKESGSGLGLTTSYWIAERHGGSLSVTSELGVGTCFVLRLPAVTGVQAPDEGRAPDAVRSARILVLDDEPEIRDVMEVALRQSGHTVECVGTGEEFLERLRLADLRNLPFDLVITDLTLGSGMSGMQAFEAMRTRGHAAPVVVMSGYSSDPILAAYRDHGFAGRLAKPFSLKVLRETVQAAVEEHA
jgi:two-component system cell cycle sensor histidine kinase/response regulator CckA